MSERITAQQVVDRMQERLGVPWQSRTQDGFGAGEPGTVVTGIVTSFAPSLDVLRRAVAAGRNMIVAREAPFWSRNAPAAQSAVRDNPTYRFKQEYIAQHRLVIFRLRDHWDARRPDPQMGALAGALGWDKSVPAVAGSEHACFALPATSVEKLGAQIRQRLRMHALRVIGDPRGRVQKAALTHGMITVAALREALREPGVDAVVVGEPVEWEASPYFLDAIAAGGKKALFVLGQEVSEEPGSGAMAKWLGTVTPEVPTEWIPAGEPFAEFV